MTKKRSENEQELKIQQLEAKIVELDHNWKRALADYQNLEKRIANERSQYAKTAGKEYISGLLPVFDTFEQLAVHVQDEGVKLALKQLSQALTNLGIERINTTGKHFDPLLMEAVDVEEFDEDGKVIKEVRSGYKMNNIILRPAHVIVGKKNIDEKVEEQVKKEEQRGDYV